jgi:hypothetical protein
MDIPDIIGLDYKNAKEILEHKGIKIANIKNTAPPRYVNNCYKDYFRVLRIDIIREKEVEILICDPCAG